MEKTEELVFGLDIGTRSIVGTVGYKKSTNDFTVVAQAVKLHDTRAMMDGQIHDINKVAETIAQVKNSLEEQIGQRLKDVCIAAAGRVLQTVTVHAKTEFPQEVSVTPELIRALEVVGVENAHQQIRAEAGDDKTNYYCVAYTVMKYYLNDFSITNLEGHRAKKIAADSKAARDSKPAILFAALFFPRMMHLRHIKKGRFFKKIGPFFIA